MIYSALVHTHHSYVCMHAYTYTQHTLQWIRKIYCKVLVQLSWELINNWELCKNFIWLPISYRRTHPFLVRSLEVLQFIFLSHTYMPCMHTRTQCTRIHSTCAHTIHTPMQHFAHTMHTTMHTRMHMVNLLHHGYIMVPSTTTTSWCTDGIPFLREFNVL